MRRFLILVKVNFLVNLRNRQVLFWNLVFPVFLMVIYGLIGSQPAGAGNPYPARSGSFIAWVLPGVLVLNALSFGLISGSAMMLDMREKGILRRLQATPLPASQLTGAYLLVNLLIVLIQTALIVLASVLLYKMPLTVQGVVLSIPMLLVGSLAFIALGQIISGIAPRAGVAVAVGQLVYFSLMFISNIILPVEVMPQWLQDIAPYLPSFLVVRLVRSTLLDNILSPNLWPDLGLLAIYIAVATYIATRLFRWEPRA